MKKKEEIVRPSNWTILNIKAREDQTPEHYVNFLERIFQNDPMVELGRKHVISMKSFAKGPLSQGTTIPKWLEMVFTTYVIVDPNAFYDKRKKEDISLDEWNNDIVANKREIYAFFVPDVHVMAVRMSNAASIKHIERFMIHAAEIFEPEIFDITIAKSRDAIRRILDSSQIISLDAQVTFSNPPHTDGFYAAFDTKFRETDAQKCHIKMQGTKDKPLQNTNDGLVSAIVSLSELNGEVKAVIIEEEKHVVINTSQYPQRLRLVSSANDLCVKLRTRLLELYGI